MLTIDKWNANMLYNVLLHNATTLYNILQK